MEFPKDLKRVECPEPVEGLTWVYRVYTKDWGLSIFLFIVCFDYPHWAMTRSR